MNKFCMVLLIAIVTPSLAMAGGGNTKKKASITFRNIAVNSDVYVILDANLATTNAGNFGARGGKVLGKGESTKYSKLKGGKHTYAFAVVAPGGAPPAPTAFTVKSTTVAAGKNRNVNLK